MAIARDRTWRTSAMIPTNEAPEKLESDDLREFSFV